MIHWQRGSARTSFPRTRATITKLSFILIDSRGCRLLLITVAISHLMNPCKFCDAKRSMWFIATPLDVSTRTEYFTILSDDRRTSLISARNCVRTRHKMFQVFINDCACVQPESCYLVYVTRVETNGVTRELHRHRNEI